MQHVLAKFRVERFNADFHFQIERGKLFAQRIKAIAIVIVRLKMNGGYAAICANFGKVGARLAVKFENGAAVDDFDFAEFARHAVKNLLIQLEICLVIAAFVVVIVAECACGKGASSAAEQYNLARLLFSDFAVSVHIVVRLQAPDLSRVRV